MEDDERTRGSATTHVLTAATGGLERLIQGTNCRLPILGLHQTLGTADETVDVVGLHEERLVAVRLSLARLAELGERLARCRVQLAPGLAEPQRSWRRERSRERQSVRGERLVKGLNDGRLGRRADEVVDGRAPGAAGDKVVDLGDALGKTLEDAVCILARGRVGIVVKALLELRQCL